MIHPAGFAGAVFGTGAWGDLRHDDAARALVADQIGIPGEWAYLDQVHGNAVQVAEEGGNQGDGDALVVFRPLLPVMVATADCVPVLIEAEGAVAAIHAGWRGALAGVVSATLEVLEANGCSPERAAIGPAIGPCCYEVGDEVAEQFPGHTSKTTWGTTSVDVPGFLASQLDGIEVWQSAECTYTSERMNSWRRDQTKKRQVAVGWLPGS